MGRHWFGTKTEKRKSREISLLPSCLHSKGTIEQNQRPLNDRTVLFIRASFCGRVLTAQIRPYYVTGAMRKLDSCRCIQDCHDQLLSSSMAPKHPPVSSVREALRYWICEIVVSTTGSDGCMFSDAGKKQKQSLNDISATTFCPEAPFLLTLNVTTLSKLILSAVKYTAYLITRCSLIWR